MELGENLSRGGGKGGAGIRAEMAAASAVMGFSFRRCGVWRQWRPCFAVVVSVVLAVKSVIAAAIASSVTLWVSLKSVATVVVAGVTVLVSGVAAEVTSGVVAAEMASEVVAEIFVVAVVAEAFYSLSQRQRRLRLVLENATKQQVVIYFCSQATPK